jgi:arylsulfatase
MLGNTPFKMYKLSMFEGGLRVPLIITWPRTITAAGTLRTQFADVTDLTPTVLDVLGLTMPATFKGVAQLPLHGASLGPTFNDDRAASPHPTQAFELRTGRAIYDRGWKAVATHVAGTSFDADRWQLYDLATDVNETRDLSAQHPEKLKALQDLWWSEAGKQGVLPLSEFQGPRLLPPAKTP